MLGLTRVLLVDRDPRLVRAWGEVFRQVDVVEARAADYFDEPADAMVSPANSFGIMDGGLDLAIRDTLGVEVERRVRRRIEERHHGELPIGAAEVIPTDDRRWPLLISAATMRVPENVAQTVHAYWAFRAVLLAVRQHNDAGTTPPIRTLLCPGLGTGVGGLPARRCAVQMHQAWLQVAGDATLPSFNKIHAVHRAMRTTE
jgi:O-acetyl-ADP-ribose deacetylase (regulator of RNase III)